MKNVILQFTDEEMEMIVDQFMQEQEFTEIDSIEDYIKNATIMHCKTMQATSKMLESAGGLEQLMNNENVHVGVVNMPIHLSNIEDKEDFTKYLNDVLNEAVNNYMEKENETIN